VQPRLTPVPSVQAEIAMALLRWTDRIGSRKRLDVVATPGNPLEAVTFSQRIISVTNECVVFKKRACIRK
jgi:hypothetical protein